MNEWILDLGDVIYDNIEEYVTNDLGNKYKNLFFTSSDINSNNPDFPAVVIKELPSTEMGVTLVNDGINAVMYGVQVEVVTNKSQGDAKRVMKSVINILKQMQFTIHEMPRFYNDDLYRLIIRARRVIGGNDIV